MTKKKKKELNEIICCKSYLCSSHGFVLKYDDSVDVRKFFKDKNINRDGSETDQVYETLTRLIKVIRFLN